MSKLKTFLSDNGMTQRAFAALVGVDPSIVSRLVDGTMTPSLNLAARIEAATKRKIPAVSWVPDAAETVRRAV